MNAPNFLQNIQDRIISRTNNNYYEKQIHTQKKYYSNALIGDEKTFRKNTTHQIKIPDRSK